MTVPEAVIDFKDHQAGDRAAVEVHKLTGPGLLESAYQEQA